MNHKTSSSHVVAVAMSGGVDSSVAAALLVEQGHEVIGIMMRLWSESDRKGKDRNNRCCTPDQMADARRVAGKLRIPFYVIDAQKYFRDIVVRPFINAHEKGITPNPCIECNRNVRFTFLLQHALALGASTLATGHYARVRRSSQKFDLLTAIDGHKDQSYVLHVLTQDQLQRVTFPLGNLTKAEVRSIARKHDLPVAEKQESMDLCFVGDGNYRRFLREHASHIAIDGPIQTENGDVIGRHTGLPDYTIGQRKGLGLAVGRPMFVIDKDIRTNSLVVGERNRLRATRVLANGVNWISGETPDIGLEVKVKIRYKSQMLEATIVHADYESVQVRMKSEAYGVTPGQGLVLYKDDQCLGGGIIAKEEHL